MVEVRCYLARVSAQIAAVGGQDCTYYAVQTSPNGDVWEALTVHRTRESADAELARLCALDEKGASKSYYFPLKEPELDWTAYFNQNQK